MSSPYRIRSYLAGGVLALLTAICIQPARATGWAVGGNGLVIRSVNAGQNWSSSNPTTSTLNALYFVSDTVGWAVGNNGIVLATTDGGDHWDQTFPSTFDLNDVFFVDSNRGWVVGQAGKILRTTNGGANWTTSTPTSATLYGVYFLTSSLGWAVGNGVVLRTTNAGANWTSAAPTMATLRDVYFIGGGIGWAVGSNGTVLKSINGGSSWTSSKPTTSGLNSVRFASETQGWAVGELGTVIKTIDGGSTWDEQRPVSTELNSVFFIDDQVGWAAGAGGAILKTTDAGVDWNATYPASVALNGIFFASIPAGVDVTVAANPPGRSFTVDDVEYTVAQTFHWDVGSPHTLQITSPQNGTAGTRYVWSNWSDGGAINHVVAPAQDASYTANFTTQYTLTMQPGANGSVSPASGWFNAGASVAIAATPNAGYGFNGWTGTGAGSYSGWANPGAVTMNGPITEAATFGPNVSVVVQGAAAGPSFVVDGTPYTTTQTFTWVPGSTHTIDAPTPQSVSADTRYVFSRWSDNGAASHTVAPVSNTTYTATFKTQYTLTTQAGAGGSVSPVSGWQDAASIVTITATPDSGYSFQSWTGTGSGAYTGSANPKKISINGPILEQATFVVGTTPAVPATLTLLPNAPNPFATETDIRFGLPQDADVHIDVFDVTGRRVTGDVVHGAPRGWQSYRLDVTGAVALRSGVYFVRVSTPNASQTGRIVVLR